MDDCITSPVLLNTPLKFPHHSPASIVKVSIFRLFSLARISIRMYCGSVEVRH